MNFTVVPPPTGGPITGYTATATPSGIKVSVPPPGAGLNSGSILVGGFTNGTTYSFTVHATNAAGDGPESAPPVSATPSSAHVPALTLKVGGPSSVTTTPTQATYTITVTNPITGSQAFPANVSVTHTLSPIPAVISATSRDGVKGISTITTTNSHGMNIGQSVTIAGVSDASFNGTFTILDVPTPTTFTYTQAGVTTTSGSGTVTGLPLSNIVLAQTSQGTCTAGGSAIITVTCNQGVLAAGATSTMTVIVQIQNQAILNSVVVSGTDSAGTALANVNGSQITTVPLPATSNLSAPVGITGNVQNPTPTTVPPQAGNITWTVSNVSPTATPNVVFTIFVPTAFTINNPNPPTPTFDNGGTGSCTASSPVPGGNQIVCTTSTLGGARKNGAKPPSTMTVIMNVSPTPAAKGVPVHPTGSVTFGPGGIDTLPSSLSLTITAK